MTAGRTPIHLRELVPLGAGLVALTVGTALGWDGRVISAVVGPPPLVRAILVGISAVVAVALFIAALRRLGANGGDGGTNAGADADAGRPDLPGMVRGIRLVFLALAALAAGAGWAMGHPLPIVVALVIAAVDVIETSFLLLVVRHRS
jgi:hypothetical protein